MKSRYLNRESFYWGLFCLISLLFIVTRLFRLDFAPFTPEGIHFDEMSAAYDAWCIQGWGCDRHLTRFPVYFMNTGPGQNALYIYLAAIMFRLFGFSVFKFRLIAVFCAIAAYICLFFMARRLFGRGIFSLVPNALMTVMPVFLMSEHWGLESYLFLSFSIILFHFLLLAIERKSAAYYILDGFIWGLTFYTYGVSYLVLPLFFVLTAIYLFYVKDLNIKMILGTGIPMLILGLPLAIEQLVINGVIEPFSVFGMDFLPMEISRVKDISLSYIPVNLLTSSVTLLSKDYLFYSSVPQYGTIFYISLPFTLAGIVIVALKTYKSLKEKKYDPYALLLCFHIAGRLISLMTVKVNTNKANEVYFAWMMFTAIGIELVCTKLESKWCLPVIAAVYMLFFLPFAKWVYSSGENSWNYQTRHRTEEYIVEDIHTGLAIQQAKAIGGDRHLQMMINDVEGRYLQICLFAGTSPNDYNTEGYEENGYSIGIPEDLDLTGDSVYLIEDELHHIADYLVTEGFNKAEAEHGGFSIVYK